MNIYIHAEVFGGSVSVTFSAMNKNTDTDWWMEELLCGKQVEENVNHGR